MVVLITGASRTGKTLLAQKLLERYRYPYLSADHLKMGLIRSGQTALTPYDDEALTDYLWGILKEIVKTAVENRQNLIIEGCYIPFDWQKSFDVSYLQQIRYICLVMSDAYIDRRFAEITGYENVIETRLPDPELCIEAVKADNRYYRQGCEQAGLDYILIDREYDIEKFSKL